MTTLQRALADQVISDLRFGADTLVDPSKVPSMILGSNKMDHEAAINCADQLASSVKNGIICGPFDTPPTANFRSNLLFKVERNGKHRLILDSGATARHDAVSHQHAPRSETPHLPTAEGSAGSEVSTVNHSHKNPARMRSALAPDLS